jgi:methylmalonyl-CoA mutase cobalamin-binding subunit
MIPAFSRDELLPSALPDWRGVHAEGVAAGRDVRRPRTAFHDFRGVVSQHEWALRCRAEGRSRIIVNIGLPDWPLTKAALREIWDQFEAAGLPPPDAYQLILERRMGLPAALREAAPQETGPALWTGDDWMDLGRTVPIQPRAALIGSPASFENTILGLSAGLDVIGNFSYFTTRYPYWDDDVGQLTSVLRALGAVSAHRQSGVVVDSYLEDGHCGTFADFRSIVGWAMFERRLVEDLCGGAYAPAFGGLTSDPFLRAAVFRAIQFTGPADAVLDGFYHGDTVGLGDSKDRNLALLVNDVNVSLAADAHFAWGSSYLPTPLTERERVPATADILEVHRLTRAMEPQARDLAKRIDWRETDELAMAIADGARAWLGRLDGYLTAIGIEADNPLELMLATRRMGAPAIERIGLGPDADLSHPTELTRMSQETRDREVERVSRSGAARLDGMAVAVGSSDVHHFAKLVIEGVLEERGVRVVDGGLEVDPEALFERAMAENCTAVVATTHNGWALNFGDRLAAERRRRGAGITLVMGGVLNEDAGGGSNSELPRDVTSDLNARGIVTTNDLVELVAVLAAAAPKG